MNHFIGITISHYKILELVGQGGMGVVYKAQDTKLDRTVALKFLPSQLTVSETDKSRFIQEAKVASAINHPNVCVIHDIQEYKEQQFIVMEYVDGMTLHEKSIKNLPKVLNLWEVVDFAIQLAEALQEAHRKGVVHRDIKSENIMIDSRNQVKVMDFGLAKWKSSLKLTKSSSTIGTLAYMAPEQIEGGEVDARSDIYSFGVVLYEMLTGKQPFEEEYESALLYAIINRDPKPVEKYRPDLSSELLHVLNRSLEKTPDERYQTVNDMLIDLRRLKRDSSRISKESIKETPIYIKREQKQKKKNSLKLIIPIGLSITIIMFYFILGPLHLFNKKILEPKIINMHTVTNTPSFSETGGRISPDGTRIAYNSNASGNWDFYVQQIASGQRINLTEDYDGHDSGGSWSPDGNWLAYKSSRNKGGIYKVSSIGGPPTNIVAEDYESISFYSWSPGGMKLTYTVNDTLYSVIEGGIPQKIPLAHKCLYFDWSPDGTRILYYTGSPYKQLWCAKSDGSDPVLVYEITGDGGFQFLTWAYDGKGIFFKSMDGELRELWWLPIDDQGKPIGSAKQLTTGLNCFSFSISKDGSKIAFNRGSANRNIYSIFIEEEGVHTIDDATLLFSDNRSIHRLTVSPEWLAFVLMKSAVSSSIWKVRRNGQNLQCLVADSSKNNYPAFSPDGKQIAFASDRSGNYEIYTMSSNGGPVTALTRHDSSDGTPTWSPDGKKIIFASDRNGNYDLWSISVNGEDLSQLTDNLANEGFPQFSPDGGFILFGSDSSGFESLNILDINKDNVTRIFNKEKERVEGFVWSNDGKKVYIKIYPGEDDPILKIYSISVADGSMKKLVDFVDPGFSNEPYGLAIDKNELFFYKRENNTDIWLADIIYN